MKFFLDANILISVLNKEYPAYIYSTRILSLTQQKKYTPVTTSVCLAIAYYFAEKKYGRISAKNRISLLVQNIDIADCGKKETILAMQNKQVHDLEDGFQYYAALHSKCICIITNDLNDFYFSSIEVLDPERFFRKYVQ